MAEEAGVLLTDNDAGDLIAQYRRCLLCEGTQPHLRHRGDGGNHAGAAPLGTGDIRQASAEFDVGSRCMGIPGLRPTCGVDAEDELPAQILAVVLERGGVVRYGGRCAWHCERRCDSARQHHSVVVKAGDPLA